MMKASHHRSRDPQPQRSTRERHSSRRKEKNYEKNEELEAQLKMLNEQLPKELKCELHRKSLHISEAEEADILQDVLIHMWQTDLAKFDASKGSLLHFAKCRMRWELATLLRQKCHEKTPLYFADIERIGDAHLPASRSPEEQLEFEEEERLLLDLPELMRLATEELPQRQIDAIMMPLEGRDLKEVARKHRVHPSSVTRDVRRALGVIRKKYDEEDAQKMPFDDDDWMDLA
ncbi:MAG: sigma-70 family RNA polymerase sigma factor [Deltaproteobacteria bacterium]|nr:sigma-70 family RNA polymerase sigma factor [Deltaproteobacteria bacterium]